LRGEIERALQPHRTLCRRTTGHHGHADPGYPGPGRGLPGANAPGVPAHVLLVPHPGAGPLRLRVARRGGAAHRAAPRVDPRDDQRHRDPEREGFGQQRKREPQLRGRDRHGPGGRGGARPDRPDTPSAAQRPPSDHDPPLPEHRHPGRPGQRQRRLAQGQALRLRGEGRPAPPGAARRRGPGGDVGPSPAGGPGPDPSRPPACPRPRGATGRQRAAGQPRQRVGGLHQGGLPEAAGPEHGRARDPVPGPRPAHGGLGAPARRRGRRRVHVPQTG